MLQKIVSLMLDAIQRRSGRRVLVTPMNHCDFSNALRTYHALFLAAKSQAQPRARILVLRRYRS